MHRLVAVVAATLGVHGTAMAQCKDEAEPIECCDVSFEAQSSHSSACTGGRCYRFSDDYLWLLDGHFMDRAVIECVDGSQLEILFNNFDVTEPSDGTLRLHRIDTDQVATVSPCASGQVLNVYQCIEPLITIETADVVDAGAGQMPASGAVDGGSPTDTPYADPSNFQDGGSADAEAKGVPTGQSTEAIVGTGPASGDGAQGPPASEDESGCRAAPGRGSGSAAILGMLILFVRRRVASVA